MENPRPRIDRLALAVLAVAVVLVLGVMGYVVYRVSSDSGEAAPVATVSADTKLAEGTAEIRAWLESKRSGAPPAAAPAPPARAPAAPSHCSTLPSAQPVPAPRAVVWALGDEGRRWRYNVEVDAPPSWKGATLTFQMFDSVRAPIVQAQFELGSVNSRFRVGTFAAGDRSHADMRFPGFFMLPVYLDQPLQDNTKFLWHTPWALEYTPNLREADAALRTGWMWNLPQLRLENGRARRYDAVVRKWEEVETPMGRILTACIEATVSYIEQGATRAVVRDTYWYSPRLAAVVKALREGLAPDESAQRIALELVDIQPMPFELVDKRFPKDTIAVELGDGSRTAADTEFAPERLAIVRERLAALKGRQLAGKRVEVTQLVTWYLRTPQAAAIEQGGRLPPIPVEEYFQIPQLRTHPYWVICAVEVLVDGRRTGGRGVVGFDGETADFASHHRQALIGAVNTMLGKL